MRTIQPRLVHERQPGMIFDFSQFGLGFEIKFAGEPRRLNKNKINWVLLCYSDLRKINLEWAE